MQPARRSSFSQLVWIGSTFLGSTLLGACRQEPPAPQPPAQPGASPTGATPAAPASPSVSVRLTTAPVQLPKPALAGDALLRVQGVAPDDVLNLRSSPSATASIVGSIPPDAVNVEPLPAADAAAPAGWQRVRHGASEGWVNSRFLVPAQSAAPPANDTLATPLLCFGNEPFWGLELNTDGSAVCGGTCEGPAGLRMQSVQKAANAEPRQLDVVTAEGKLFLRATIRHTGKCSDGMSDNEHPFEFSAQGTPGKLSGCCRVKPKEP